MLTVKVNELTLAYERSGRGTPLVLLHGYPLDHSIWEPMLGWLEKDFDLIRLDLRGFGESETAKTNSSMAILATDVAGLLDQMGIQKAAIVGHSMGGYVALAFARAYPGRCLGLGLVSSQALADTPERKAGRYQEADSILAEGVSKAAEDMSDKMTADLVLKARLKELILQQRPEGLADALRAMAGRPDSTGLLSSLALPLMVVHGLADKLIPVERARLVKEAAARALLTEIPEAGHVPMMEFPEATAKALKGLK